MQTCNNKHLYGEPKQLDIEDAILARWEDAEKSAI